ncbi:MAG: phosphatase PAP2 family protein [Acidimicrobiia bacterium]|nr:phosphatase PAP2 family protein [Acidimicrobiia bacterium]
MTVRARSPHRSSPFAVRYAIPARLAAAIVALSAAVAVVSSIAAADGDVAGWEAAGLRFFNEWPDWLEPPMWVLQQVGVIGSPVVAGLIVVWFTRKWQHLIPFVLVLPLKLGIEKAVVKQLVERERPFVSIGPDINVRGPAFEGLSFPSGHATTAFALAILMSGFLPRSWWPLPLTWAAVVGIARLYYGEHNVLDVVAGAALGTAFATILWLTVLNRLVSQEV